MNDQKSERTEPTPLQPMDEPQRFPKAAMEKERVALVEMADKMNQAIGWYEKERAEVERLKTALKATGLNIDAYLGVCDERDDLRRQLDEAERALKTVRYVDGQTVEQWRAERQKAERECAEWQAVAGKKDAALKKLVESSVFVIQRSGLTAGTFELNRDIGSARLVISTPPATALLDELERAWKEGYCAQCSLDWTKEAKSAWLASETRQRFTTASQSDSNE